MVCKYRYRIGDKEFGNYQCDVDDFKKFYKCMYSKLDNIIVELGNGNVWIWYKKFFYKINKVEYKWERVK